VKEARVEAIGLKLIFGLGLLNAEEIKAFTRFG